MYKKKFRNKFFKFKLIDGNYDKPGKIHALLGVSTWVKIIESEIVRSSDHMAIAHKSKLGYIVLANEKNPYKVQNPYMGAVARGALIKALTEIIQKWLCDSFSQWKSERKGTQNLRHNINFSCRSTRL